MKQIDKYIVGGFEFPTSYNIDILKKAYKIAKDRSEICPYCKKKGNSYEVRDWDKKLGHIIKIEPVSVLVCYNEQDQIGNGLAYFPLDIEMDTILYHYSILSSSTITN